MADFLLPGIGFVPDNYEGLIPGIGFVQNTSTGSTAATALSIAGATSGMAGYPSENITISVNGDLAGDTLVTITQTDGATTPDDVTLSSTVLGATFTYTAASAGTKTITVSAPGLTSASLTFEAAAYVAPAAVSIASVVIDGDDVTVNFNLGDQTDSGQASLTGSNGGVSKPAQPITIDNTANTGTVTFVDCVPGTYSAAATVFNVVDFASMSGPANIVIGEISGEIGEGGQTSDPTPPVMQGVPTISAIGQTTATASWPSATDGVGVTGYEYRLNGGSWINVGMSQSVVIGSLTASTFYTFDVRAFDAAGNRATPISETFLTSEGNVAITVPGAPTGLLATAINQGVVVSFSPPESNGGAAIDYYTVTLSTGQTGTGTGSPISVAAPAGVAVTATVTATNQAGTGPASAQSNSVTPVLMRRALINVGGLMVEMSNAQIGTGLKPLVLVGTRIRQRQASEGTPLVKVGNRLRVLHNTETLES